MFSQRKYIFGSALATVLILSTSYYVQPILSSAVNLAARQGCSLYFAAGLTLPLARETYIHRHVRPIGPYIVFAIDETKQTVRASLLGALTANAQHRDGYGCVLDHGEAFTPLTPLQREQTRKMPLNQAC